MPDEPRSQRVQVCVTPRVKRAVVKAARAAGRTVSDWAARVIEAATDGKPG